MLSVKSVKVVAFVSMSEEGVEGSGTLKEPERRCELMVLGEGIEIEGESATIGAAILRINSTGSGRSSSSRTCSSPEPRCDGDR